MPRLFKGKSCNGCGAVFKTIQGKYCLYCLELEAIIKELEAKKKTLDKKEIVTQIERWIDSKPSGDLAIGDKIILDKKFLRFSLHSYLDILLKDLMLKKERLLIIPAILDDFKRESY